MKPIILLVDDEEEFITLLEEAIDLSLPRYEAVICTSVDEAHQRLAALQDPTNQLALVCVDQRLRGQMGLKFIEHIRQRYPDVPAVLFTGKATPREGAHAREIGATVLWKPLRLSSWIREIRVLLSPRGRASAPSLDSLPLSWRPNPT